jgi:hypothetical protein
MGQKTKKMGKWSFSKEELDRRFAEASRLGEKALQTDPRAKSVSYDPQNRRLLIDMLDGSLLGIPIEYIQGLANASNDEIKTMQLSPLGDALRWESRNLEFSVAGLAGKRFGNRAWMAELGRKGGSKTSPAKTAAAKANGRKGGRPRNVRVFAELNSESFQTVAIQQDLEFLDTDLSDQSHMATEVVVEYERMIVGGYQALMRKLKAAHRELPAAASSAELPNLKASIKLPHSQLREWAEGTEDAEFPIAA